MHKKSGKFHPRNPFSSFLAIFKPKREIELDSYQIRFVRWQADEGGFKEWDRESVEFGLEGTLKLSADAVRSEDGILTGEITSPVIETGFDIASVVPSWNVDAPEDSWVKVLLRVKIEEVWTRWYNLGIWSESGEAADRHSVKGQDDNYVEIATDTVILKEGVKSNCVQMKIQLNTRSDSEHPVINGAALVIDNRNKKNFAPSRGNTSLWGKTLPVPQYSQMVYADGGNVWCSPTSVSMILSFWQDYKGLPEPVVRETVAGVFDAEYEGTGNWPFNMAYAATKGLTAAVGRLANLEQAEKFIAAGIPLALSVSWKPGELTGAPVEKSDGHLIVLAGFDAGGNPVINDPAAKEDALVQRVYQRGELERLWRTTSGGIVYIITPLGITWPV